MTSERTTGSESRLHARTLPTRLPSLDALRGVAALVVVVHHAMLVDPVFGGLPGGAEPRPEGLAWMLTHTPLALVRAGGEAVLVFFVLSGLVLALPYARGSRPSWVEYYPRRLLRLYLPVWGAVLLAMVQLLAVPRSPEPGLSEWLLRHDTPATLRTMAIDGSLVFGTTWANSALWSLRWEVWFSLLLPLYLLVVRIRWLRMPTAGAILLVLVFASDADPALAYLPVFAVGVLLAYSAERLLTLAAALSRGAWLTLLTVALLALVINVLPGDQGSWGHAVAVVGASLLVFCFLAWPAIGEALRGRPWQWLGKISFSLYLVHEPIVVTLAFLSGISSAGVMVALGVPLCLLAATVFTRWVELPSHRLSRRVGKAARRLTSGRNLPTAD